MLFLTKGIQNFNELIVHKSTHTGEKTLQCSFCQKDFIQPGGLTVHKHSHIGEKAFQSFIQYWIKLRHLAELPLPLPPSVQPSIFFVIKYPPSTAGIHHA